MQNLYALFDVLQYVGQEEILYLNIIDFLISAKNSECQALLNIFLFNNQYLYIMDFI